MDWFLYDGDLHHKKVKNLLALFRKKIKNVSNDSAQTTGGAMNVA